MLWLAGHLDDAAAKFELWATKTELWAALIGAAVGGLLTSRAADRQMRHERDLTRQQMRHERDLSTKAFQDQRNLISETASKDTAVLLLDALADFQEHAGGLRRMVQEGGAERNNQAVRTRAADAVSKLRTLDRSRALLLPKEINERWYALLIAIETYRDASIDPGGWTAEQINRAGAEALRYAAYVRETLVRFVETLEVIAHVDPPKPRRPITDPDWAFTA